MWHPPLVMCHSRNDWGLGLGQSKRLISGVVSWLRQARLKQSHLAGWGAAVDSASISDFRVHDGSWACQIRTPSTMHACRNCQGAKHNAGALALLCASREYLQARTMLGVRI